MHRLMVILSEAAADTQLDSSEYLLSSQVLIGAPPTLDSHPSLPPYLSFAELKQQFVGRKAIATGWGTLKEDGKPSCILQEVEVPVISNEKCVSQTNYTSKMITGNMLCAGYPGKGERDSCQGDSGGPLCVERDDPEKRLVLIGVVSWGNGCARKDFPGVYTRVTRFLQWIKDNSKDGCFCQD